MSEAPRPDEVLFTREQIRRRVASLGRQISREFAGSEPVLITVLKGGVFFLADLARAITLPVTLDFLAISSYGPGVAGGEVRITKDLDESIVGRDVLVVEDVIDTGLTLGYIVRALASRQPRRLRICILFDRPRRRLVDLPIDYVGFELPDRFAVGYGLDWRGQYRNLPHVAALAPDPVVGWQGGPPGSAGPHPPGPPLPILGEGGTPVGSRSPPLPELGEGAGG